MTTRLATPLSFIRHRLLRLPYRLHIAEDVGEGPVIILLHGIASSSHNWRYLTPLLSRSYRCVSIDLLGFGNSPKPDHIDYTIEQHVASIRATIRNLRLDGPVILLGHSLGSLLAVRYTAQYAGDVSRLILLSPPVYVERQVRPGKSGLSLDRTTLYMAFYRFIRTHPRVTAENVAKAARMLQIPSSFMIDEATWLPFIKTLERCIEYQTVMDDIVSIPGTPIDLFYGTFDQFIIPRNIKLLEAMRHVTAHQLTTDHAVGKRYARAVAALLIGGQPVVADDRPRSSSSSMRS